MSNFQHIFVFSRNNLVCCVLLSTTTIYGPLFQTYEFSINRENVSKSRETLVGVSVTVT
jgi:hypothetical protein